MAKVIMIHGVPHVQTSVGMSGPKKLVAQMWNQAMMAQTIRDRSLKLKHVVEKLQYKVAKETVVKLWKELHDQFGYGYGIPVHRLHGITRPLSQCDKTWLQHHGINSDGTTMADFFRSVAN